MGLPILNGGDQLSGAGFRPVGARLLATAAGTAPMVFYSNGKGDVISVT